MLVRRQFIPTPPTSAECSCFHGTAYLLGDECRCSNDTMPLSLGKELSGLIFGDDDTLGRDPSDPPQLPPVGGGDTGDCSCVTGTAYRDASGNCRCDNGIPQLGNYGGPRGITEHAVQYILPWQPLLHADEGAKAPAAADFTIFGLSPLVALGIAAAGLWAFSSMGGNTKKSRGGDYV